MRITKSDFNNWWNGPVGMEVRKMLMERKSKLAHISASGALIGLPGTLQENYGKVAGRYEEIDNLLEMSFEELMGDK